MSKHINGMKNLLPKFVMTVLIALFSLNANAYDAYIDGIYYNLVKKTKTAEVTYGEKESGTYSGDIIIPTSIEQDGIIYDVTSIGSKAFYLNWDLTSIVIPNSVTSINDDAFYGCRKLSCVNIPNRVITIGDGAFASCNQLASVNIPNSVTFIGVGAFQYCI